MPMSNSLSLGLHAAGLIVVYSLYGVLQERIMKGTYGPDNIRFTSSSLLILCNRMFSIGVGACILLYKSRQDSGTGSTPTMLQRMKPASPLFAYAAVAFFNFLSTTCQYEALKYVSYTTQSLAKCAKMVPVLVVGAVIYKKKHAPKEWVAGGIILVGCGTYLFSNPPANKHHAAVEVDASAWSAILGALFLGGYLFFDGLVSTTQERVFGKNPSSSDPFGPESPVLDQMIWTNFFAGIIAVSSALLSSVSGSLLPNLELLLTTPALMWDVCIFSGASAIGLIILLNTIASFGALTSSLIMTTRQFLSILINAGIFGNFSTVGIQGWTGVGWVASGIYIKMNKKYDPPKQPKTTQKNASDAMNPEELQSLAVDVGEAAPPPHPVHPKTRLLYQYGIPIATPILLAILATPFILGTTPSFDPSSLQVWKTKAPQSPSSVVDTATLAANTLGVQGGKWDHEIYNSVNPNCSQRIETTTFEGATRTGFVSYPRSGNSYLRGLIERSSGYRTSSIYCDRGLEKTFLGECDTKSQFFVKTHYPALLKQSVADSEEYYKRFDQVVHLVRNPLDSVASWWHLEHVGRTPGATDDQEIRVEAQKFGQKQRDEIIDLAKKWRDHAIYWATVPLLTHTLRYEDLKVTPLPNMMSLLSFLLPSDGLPPLTDVACMVEDARVTTPYKSRKFTDFASWDSWEPELRLEVLSITRRPFCKFGYDKLLARRLGRLADVVPELDRFCINLPFEEMALGADFGAAEQVEDDAAHNDGRGGEVGK